MIKELALVLDIYGFWFPSCFVPAFDITKLSRLTRVARRRHFAATISLKPRITRTVGGYEEASSLLLSTMSLCIS